jgi:glycosyltransferase involved in cell wall biosynthesis
MKVLLASPLPPPPGGIESWSLNLLSYLSHKPDGNEVIHQNTALRYRRMTQNDFIHRFLFGIGEFIRTIANLMANIREHRPDVIHLTSSGSFAIIKPLLIFRIAERNKIPLIVHWRFGRIPTLAVKRNWEWKLLRYVIKKTSSSIVVDEKSYNALHRSGLKNVVYIPNPIAFELEQKAKRLLGAGKERQQGRVIFVGHIIKNKGVYELVEACSQIPIIKELLLIGPYEMNVKKGLFAIAGKRDNGNWLRSLGALPWDQVLEYMLNSPILALPSYTEGFPNVVIEAMAMGCAVIATDVGAIPELLAFKSQTPCGICVPAQNIEKLKDAILALVECPQDAEALGKRGMERIINSYSIEKIIEQYRSVWENAANR